MGIDDRVLKFSNAPLLVQSLANADIKQVACGGEHSGAITARGDAFMWGRNQEGQCGLRSVHETRIYKPTSMPVQDLLDHIDLGDLHSCFITKEQILMTCGDNSNGQCGQGNDSEIFIPTPKLVLSIQEPIKQVSSGYRHTLCLTKRGIVFGFGSNRTHEMGLGESKFSSQKEFHVPLRMTHLEMHDITQVAAGGFSAALTSSKSIIIWGSGEFGQFVYPQKVCIEGINF